MMKSLNYLWTTVSYLSKSAMANKEDMPIVLDSSNFYNTVLDRETGKLQGTKPWFIEFYAPWCPHCMHLAPVWDDLHRQNKDKVNVARVDCTSQNGRSLCSEYQVHGYPTLLFFEVGQDQQYQTYRGQRTLEAFEEYINEHVGHH